MSVAHLLGHPFKKEKELLWLNINQAFLLVGLDRDSREITNFFGDSKLSFERFFDHVMFLAVTRCIVTFFSLLYFSIFCQLEKSF